MTNISRFFLATLLTCFSFFLVCGQQNLSIQWQRTIGTNNNERWDDLAGRPNNVITQCFDGGYAVVAHRPYNQNAACDRVTYTGERLWLIKFDKNGIMQWEKCYGGQFNIYGYVFPTAVIQASDSGFVITGNTSFTDGDFEGNHSAYDAFVIKTTRTGQVQWSKCYGGSRVESFNSIVQDTEGNYIVAGTASSNDGDVVGIHAAGTPFYDAWILKLNSTGQILWQHCFGSGYEEERFYSVELAKDNSCIAVGDAVMVKINKNGVIVWEKGHLGNDIALDANDNIYLSTDFRDAKVLKKIDSSGNLIWTKDLFDASYGEFSARAIQCLNDTSIVILGATGNKQHILSGLHFSNPSWTYPDYFIAQLDSSGRVSDVKCFGGSEEEQPTYFIPTPDKGFLIMGLSRSTDGDIFKNIGLADFWLIKVGSYNTVKGKLFYDYNDNGIQDAGESYFSNVAVTSDKNGSFNGSYANNGTFQHTIDTGAFITKPLIQKPYFTIKPSALNTNYTDYGHIDSVNFAIVPVPGIKDLTVYLHTERPQRPGFKNLFSLICNNLGTEVIQEAVVGFKKDSLITILQHDSLNFFQSGDTLFWRLANIEPQQSKTINIEIQNPAPPGLNIGDSLFHYIQVTPFSNDSTDTDNRDTIRQQMVGSYDPNNKLDDVGGTMYYENYKRGDYLVYTINFQNTGTDTAFTIVIRDSLSNKLDWRSLEMVAASHRYSMSIQNGNKIQWRFSDIQLPDSNRNERKSHGYVVYKIKPRIGLTLGEVIYNTASIYFDYNLPIQTNKQSTTLKSKPLAKPILAGIKTSYCQNDETIKGKITNLPVLNSGIITTVKLDNNNLSIANDSTFNFNLSNLSPGNHIISVTFSINDNKSVTNLNFSIIAPLRLDLNLAANIISVTNLNDPVLITGSVSASNGTLYYTFAKDRAFTMILQSEGNNNFLNIHPSTLTIGENWIYAKVRTNESCYDTQTNIDSILITRSLVTGIVDGDFPGKVITVFPNPFSKTIHVKGLNSGKKYTITIATPTGQEIYRLNTANQFSVEIKDFKFPTGFYLFNIFNDRKKLGTIKLFKN